jgi:hypothetical protein
MSIQYYTSVQQTEAGAKAYRMVDKWYRTVKSDQKAAVQRPGHLRRRIDRMGKVVGLSPTFTKARILQAQSAVRCMPMFGRLIYVS